MGEIKLQVNWTIALQNDFLKHSKHQMLMPLKMYRVKTINTGSMLCRITHWHFKAFWNCYSIKPRVLKSHDVGSLMRAQNQWFETKDLQRFWSFSLIIVSKVAVTRLQACEIPLDTTTAFILWCLFGKHNFIM